MKFTNIPKLTRNGAYQFNCDVDDIDRVITRYEKEHGLQMCPDFQRGHVWTEKQQIAFVEFVIRGGNTSPIYFNHEGWMTTFEGEFVCVDGLQRITALQRFIRNEIKVFDHYFNEFEDKIGSGTNIIINVNNLKTRKEVLQWYIDLNSGGTIHTEDEINKVKQLLENENG